jgi:hypothetical protein
MEDVAMVLLHHHIDESHLLKLLPGISQDFQTLGVDFDKFTLLTEDRGRDPESPPGWKLGEGLFSPGPSLSSGLL